MKKVIENLKNIVSSISGKLVYIGNMENDILKRLENNLNITYCDILGSTEGTGIGKKKKGKSINMKDFRKFYKKKNVDNMICDIKDIKKHLPRFISTSIYICSGKVYIYGNKDIYVLEPLVKKYKRYSKDIKVTEYINDYVIEVDLRNSKNKFIMDKLYYIIDILGLLADKISDLIIGG